MFLHPDVQYSTRECPFHFIFPNIYCYFRSFALLTVNKYYFISIICISRVNTEVELSSYAYNSLLCLFYTLSSLFLEKNPILVKEENHGEHLFYYFSPCSILTKPASPNFPPSPTQALIFKRKMEKR